MSNKNKNVRVHIVKADSPTQISNEEHGIASEWIFPPADMRGYKEMVSHSSILPQCIHAYKNNIAGFGLGIRYKEDYEDETEEMKNEYDYVAEIIELLNMDMDTKEVLEDVIEARETYGIAYLEVIRNFAGEITGIEFIKDTPTILKTKPLEPYIDVEYYYKDRTEIRPRKFRKYKQEIGSQIVYFRELGDPRIMDRRTGEYLEKGNTLDVAYQANEIIEFAIGTEPYGEVRWIGQILGIDGSQKAESLNNRYFKEGRHTPLMIVLKGGTLTDDSFAKLQDYMNGIKGENGQHAFMILEVENSENKIDFMEEKKPDIEIKDLANVLQKDELFQDYLENNRRKVQSAFQLPDLYVGYTTDFNRATAQTAQEVTEKQVFQPERRSLEWIINNKLLSNYKLQYVEVYFKEPDITNVDDLSKILNIVERAGGLTPNKAKEIAYSVIGETSEDYESEWGETPLQYLRSIPVSATTNFAPDTLDELGLQMTQQIQKAETQNDEAVVAVMKEVRDLLIKMEAVE